MKILSNIINITVLCVLTNMNSLAFAFERSLVPEVKLGPSTPVCSSCQYCRMSAKSSDCK